MQIVGYRGSVDGPARLQIAVDGALEERRLEPGTTIEYALGERHCAGAVRNDSHRPCPNEEAPHCVVHRDRWPCARCSGECDYPIEACREPHAIYLAAFAPATFKVGVTRTWRVERRLSEQGADRGAILTTVEDGRRARAIEADHAERSGLSDRVRVSTKIAGLHRAVDEDAWNAFLSDFEVESRHRFTYDHDLTRPAVPATLAAGTVRGSQGRVLVLERSGTGYAVDMRELVGHELPDAAPTPDLQTGLGAFE